MTLEVRDVEHFTIADSAAEKKNGRKMSSRSPRMKWMDTIQG